MSAERFPQHLKMTYYDHSIKRKWIALTSVNLNSLRSFSVAFYKVRSKDIYDTAHLRVQIKQGVQRVHKWEELRDHAG